MSKSVNTGINRGYEVMPDLSGLQWQGEGGQVIVHGHYCASVQKCQDQAPVFLWKGMPCPACEGMP